MQEVKVSFYLKRNEEKADGTVPVLGRIRIGKSMVQFSAKVCVPVSLWDTKSGRAVGKSKTALTINTSLNKISVAIHSAYRELSLKKDHVSAGELKNAFQGIASEQDTLVKYYEAHNEKFLKNVGVNRAEGTYKRFLTSLGHLKRFMRKKYNIADIPFQALTPSFFADYDYYLCIELGLACGTIINTIVHLRRIIKIAINNGLVRNDPFVGYKYITEEPVPKSLTADELQTLIKTKLSRANLNFIRDMFLFSSFTGLSYADVKNLRESNIREMEDGSKWIIINRQKTGTLSYIPLLEIPLHIIEKYRGTGKDGKLFNLMNSPEVNLYLKDIAKAAGIDKRLSYHVARHSFSTSVCLSQCIHIETISQILGHINIRTTQIYAEVTKTKINEDMTNLAERIAGKYELPRVDDKI